MCYQDPGADKPVAHGGAGLVQHPQQGALFLAAPDGLGELQRPPGGEVQLQIALAPGPGRFGFLEEFTGLDDLQALLKQAIRDDETRLWADKISCSRSFSSWVINRSQLARVCFLT